MIFCAAQPDQIPALWPDLMPLVEAALVPDYTPEHVRAMLEEGRAQLWYTREDEGIDAMLITQINTFPARRVCLAWVCSGHLPAGWAMLFEMVAVWAAQQGCSAMSIHGRPGWERVLKSLGWNAKEVWLERDLSHLHSTVQ